MRKITLIAATLFVLASYSNAQAANLYSMKLCPDLGHSQWLVVFHPPSTEFDVWVWWLPDPTRGMAGGAYRINLPLNVVKESVTSNPLIAVESGTPTSGSAFSISDSDCQYDWFWSHRQTCLLINSTPAYIQVWPSPSGTVDAMSCEPGHPRYEATFAYMWVNAGTATQKTSWGAIKSIFGQ
jgi:hypothetical protein